MEFRVLGPLEVVDAGRSLPLGGTKQRSVLAMLLLEAGRVVSVDRLVEGVWGDGAHDRAVATLQVYVSNLRKLVEPDRGGVPQVLVSQRPGYRLQVDRDQLDLARFEALAAEARRDAAELRPAEAVARLDEALALWRGQALADVAFEPFASAEVARLEEARTVALEDRLDAALVLGRHAELVGELEALVCAHPLRERLRGQLVLALYRSGRQAEALRAYADAREMLREELGIDPSPALQDLERRVLAQDPSLAAPAQAPEPNGAVGAGSPAQGPAELAVGDEVPLPPAVEQADAAAFVGRSGELERVRAQWDLASGGQARFVLVGGEPGIGKTRLAARFAAEVRSEGATVLAGRCDEEALRPYQPWAEAVGGYLRSCSRGRIPTSLGRGAALLARLLPELADRLPELPEPLWSDPETERFRLFEAVASFLAELCRTRPLLVVLDDLHWADKGTVLLLRHLLRRAEPAAVMVLATHRDTQAEQAFPLAEALGDLRRERVVERLALSGLGEAEVKALLDATANPDADARASALARGLRAETEGNPFFIGELIRHLAETGAVHQRDGRWISDRRVDQLGIPEQVQEVVARRLAHLSEAANRTLATAAVVGREFRLDVLEALGDLDEDSLLDALEEAATAGVVREVPEALGAYAFSHALVRETLYEKLSAVRRVRLHRRIGEALEALHGPASSAATEAHLPQLAYHFCEAARAGGGAKAADYARRAGDRSLRLLAYEEAIRHYEAGLGALEADPSSAGDGHHDEARCDLSLLLGEALWRAGDAPRARAFAERSVALARRLGDPDRLGRAALGLGGAGFRPFVYETGAVDEPLVTVLAEALDACPRGDSALRVRLLGFLAQELYFAPGSYGRRRRLAEEAVATARRLGEPATLAYALATWHTALWRPANAEQRLGVASEVLRLAEEIGHRELAAHARHFRITDLVELGDLVTMEAELGLLRQLADELRVPYYRWTTTWYGAMRALLVGSFAEAERLVLEAFELGQQVQGADVMQSFGVQLGTLRREQGRFGELESSIAAFADQYPNLPAWRAALALLYAETDRPDEARREFERLADHDFADVPEDLAYLTAVAISAEVCASLGDRARAGTLHRLLTPYRDRAVAPASAVAFWGFVSYYLGLLAAVLGRFEEAEGHFRAALDASARAGAEPSSNRTRVGFARMLLARGAPGDAAEAARLLDEAVVSTERLGMDCLLATALELKLAPAGTGVPAAGGEAGPPPAP